MVPGCIAEASIWEPTAACGHHLRHVFDCLQHQLPGVCCRESISKAKGWPQPRHESQNQRKGWLKKTGLLAWDRNVQRIPGIWERSVYNQCTNHTTTVQKTPAYWPLCNLLNQTWTSFGKDGGGPTTASYSQLAQIPLKPFLDEATRRNQRHTDLGIPRFVRVFGGAMAATGSLMASQNKELWEKAFTLELVCESFWTMLCLAHFNTTSGRPDGQAYHWGTIGLRGFAARQWSPTAKLSDNLQTESRTRTGCSSQHRCSIPIAQLDQTRDFSAQLHKLRICYVWYFVCYLFLFPLRLVPQGNVNDMTASRIHWSVPLAGRVRIQRSWQRWMIGFSRQNRRRTRCHMATTRATWVTLDRWTAYYTLLRFGYTSIYYSSLQINVYYIIDL